VNVRSGLPIFPRQALADLLAGNRPKA